MQVRILSGVPFMLIDKGDCYYDTEAKFIPIYDKNGNYAGGYYCPYIPKVIFEKENHMLYKIKKGDTLSAIARTFGTSVNDIMAANPGIRNKNLIYTGDSIEVPVNIKKGVTGIFGGLWKWYKGLLGL